MHAVGSRSLSQALEYDPQTLAEASRSFFDPSVNATFYLGKEDS